MFGLTVEKLFVVALLAAVIIGPRRLPAAAARLAGLLRAVTAYAVDARRRVEQESGAADVVADWKALDPRQYDPRRIIREAWAGAESAQAAAPEVGGAGGAGHAERSGESDTGGGEPIPEGADDVVPAAVAAPASGRWIVSGTSAHPRRIWVPTEP